MRLSHLVDLQDDALHLVHLRLQLLSCQELLYVSAGDQHILLQVRELQRRVPCQQPRDLRFPLALLGDAIPELKSQALVHATSVHKRLSGAQHVTTLATCIVHDELEHCRGNLHVRWLAPQHLTADVQPCHAASFRLACAQVCPQHLPCKLQLTLCSGQVSACIGR